jgi:hypothetical protein
MVSRAVVGKTFLSWEEEIDAGTKIFEEKVLMEFSDVSKTGFRIQIRQRVPEICHFSCRNPHKLNILNVAKTKKKMQIAYLLKI